MRKAKRQDKKIIHAQEAPKLEKFLNDRIQFKAMPSLLIQHMDRVRTLDNSGDLDITRDYWFTTDYEKKDPYVLASHCPLSYESYYPILPSGQNTGDRLICVAGTDTIRWGGLHFILADWNHTIPYQMWRTLSPFYALYSYLDAPRCKPFESIRTMDLEGIYMRLRAMNHRHKSIWWKFPVFRREIERIYLRLYRIPLYNRNLYDPMAVASMGHNLRTWGIDSKALASFLNCMPMSVCTDNLSGWAKWPIFEKIIVPRKNVFEDYLSLL